MAEFHRTAPELSTLRNTWALLRSMGVIRTLILLPLLVVGFQLLAWSMQHLSFLIAFPFPHDTLEGTLLHEARLLWAGEPLYQPLERYRFVSAPYPPLHPALLGLADQIPGPHVFWGGRLLSLVAASGIALLIVLLVQRGSRSWTAGVLGAILFLSTPPVLLWATRIKPDMTALLLTTLGLYCASWAFGETQRPAEPSDGAAQLPSRRYRLPWLSRPLTGALVCFTLAIFTKQTMVIAPLATGMALLTNDVRDFRSGDRQEYIGSLPLRKRTLAFGTLYLGLILVVWVALDLFTSGNYTRHVWGLHRSEWWSVYLLRKFVALLEPYWPLMLCGVGLLIWAIWMEQIILHAWYLVLAPISLLGAAETGANHNHLMEMLLALAIGSSTLFGLLLGLRARWLILAIPVAVLLVMQLRLAFDPHPWFIGELKPDDPPERFLIYIQNTPGEILADDVGLLLQAGRPLRYNDPSTMGPAAKSGVWDQQGLLDDIAHKRFSAIMIPFDVCTYPSDPSGRWSVEAIQAICKHYQLKFRDRINTYVPKEP